MGVDRLFQLLGDQRRPQRALEVTFFKSDILTIVLHSCLVEENVGQGSETPCDDQDPPCLNKTKSNSKHISYYLTFSQSDLRSTP